MTKKRVDWRDLYDRSFTEYRPGLKPYEVTASTEDNLWHMVEPGKKFTLCGKKADRSRYVDPNAGQEVMERLTGKDITEVMDCPDCREIARVGGENSGDQQ